MNLFVDGVCIKVGINGNVASYYENRLATGTYEVEVRSQYTSNNVESFGLKKTVSIEADPGLTGKTPAELADPAYSEYKEYASTTAVSEATTTAAVETTTTAAAGNNYSCNSGNNHTPVAVAPTLKPTEKPTTVAPTTNANAQTTTKKQPSQTTIKSSVNVGKAVVKAMQKRKVLRK